MAGQLGLDPPIMELVEGGARRQADRALRSCEKEVFFLPLPPFPSPSSPPEHKLQWDAVDGGATGIRPAPYGAEHKLQWGAVDGGAIGSGPPDHGAGGGRGDETGREGAEETGREGAEETGREGAEETGREGAEETGREGAEEPGREGAEEPGREGAEEPGREGAEERSLLWMAGQLGLDPSIMELVGGGARRQAERALRSCEAVAAVVKGRDGAVGWGKGGGGSEEEGNWEGENRGGGSGGGGSGGEGWRKWVRKGCLSVGRDCIAMTVYLARDVVGGERGEVARAVEEFFAAARRKRREIWAAEGRRSGTGRMGETGEGEGEMGIGDKGGRGGESGVAGRGEEKREVVWGVGQWWVVGHGREEGGEEKSGKESAADGGGSGIVGATRKGRDFEDRGEGEEEGEELEEEEEEDEEEESEGVIAADPLLQCLVVPGLPKGAAVEIAPLLAAPPLSSSSATSAAPWPSSLTPLHLQSTSAPCHVSNADCHTSVLGNQLAGMSLGEGKEGRESAEADKETGAKEVDRVVGDAAETDRHRGAEGTDSMAEGAVGRREGDEGEMQRRVAVGGGAEGGGAEWGGAEGVSISGRGTAAAGAFCRVHLRVEQTKGEQRGGCEGKLPLACEAAGEGEGSMGSCADSLVDGVAGGCVRVLSDALHVARLDWPDVAKKITHYSSLPPSPLFPSPSLLDTTRSTPQMLRVYVAAGGPIPIPALSLAVKTHLSKTLHNRTQSQASHETPASSHQHGPSAVVAEVLCPIVVPVTAVGPTAAVDALLAVEMTAFGV
ncbi:unnamed protein product [Closterium sp. Naga37s-1]|nr:unnamed protein product [Closterium sp. Naga37s-1]